MATHAPTRRRMKHPQPSPAAPGNRESPWLVWLLLVVTTLVVFAPVVSSKFTTWDDNLNVSKNPWFNPPTTDSMLEMWRHPVYDLYIPLTYTVWGILASLAELPVPDSDGMQLNPAVFHVANLLVHLSAVLMLYALLRHIVGRRWPAAAGALLFAIHPIQVEPVAWVTGMKDVLSGALSIASLWQYVLYANAERHGLSFQRRRIHYGISLATFVLALLAKPSAVMVPAAAIVLDAWIMRRSWPKVWRAVAPMLVISAGWMLHAKMVQTVAAPADGGRAWLRPLIATDTLAFYLYKLIFPLRLGFHYDRAPLTVIQHHWLYYTWIFPAAVAGVLVVFSKKLSRFLLLPSAALFVVGIVPVLGLVPFAFQRYATVADRYLYVSMIGPALALAALLGGMTVQTNAISKPATVKTGRRDESAAPHPSRPGRCNALYLGPPA